MRSEDWYFYTHSVPPVTAGSFHLAADSTPLLYCLSHITAFHNPLNYSQQHPNMLSFLPFEKWNPLLTPEPPRDAALCLYSPLQKRSPQNHFCLLSPIPLFPSLLNPAQSGFSTCSLKPLLSKSQRLHLAKSVSRFSVLNSLDLSAALIHLVLSFPFKPFCTCGERPTFTKPSVFSLTWPSAPPQNRPLLPDQPHIGISQDSVLGSPLFSYTHSLVDVIQSPGFQSHFHVDDYILI